MMRAHFSGGALLNFLMQHVFLRRSPLRCGKTRLSLRLLRWEATAAAAAAARGVGGVRGGVGFGHQRSAASQGIKDVSQASEI